MNERELEAILEKLEFEFRCSVNALPTQVWLRLVRFKMASAVTIVVLMLIALFFKRDIRALLE